MFQLPYAEISAVFALIIVALALFECSTKGRIAIIGILLISFALPIVFPSSAVSLICTIGRLLFGIGCFIYLRYRAVI